MLWYIKQLIPLSYWTTYAETESGKKFFVIWRMWFGRSFNITKFEIGG